MKKGSKVACCAAISVSVIAAAAYLFWSRRVGGWEAVQDGSGWQKWRRGTVTHIDRNGDGMVDWEIDHKVIDDYIEREDTDFDGFFDRRFHRGVSGSPYKVVEIHEKAPRH